MRKHIVLWGILFGLPSCFLQAQTPAAPTGADVLLEMQKLKVLGSVLYVAAHPDDENTRLLAYLAKERKLRTGYLSLTRGDGGQNLIGEEQGIELGMIRTQELLSARRTDGAEQFFTRAYDFGFSKSTEEALQFWDHEKILSDVVWVIRKFRPDVVITRFPKDSRAGHGHHSASAVLAEEAFLAAGDPARFPEQLAFVQPWKPTRLLWNSFNFGGGTNTQSADQFKLEVGAFNPLLGKGYGEIAAESRSQHKSQGFGVARQRGSMLEYFATWQGTAPQQDILEGVDLSWKRVEGTGAIESQVESLLQSFQITDPVRSVAPLASLYKQIQALPTSYWKEQKLREVQRLMEYCSGLWIEATSSEGVAVQTDKMRLNIWVNNRSGANIKLKQIQVAGFDTVLQSTLGRNANLQFSKTLTVPDTMPLSQPYWLQKEMKEGYFQVDNPLLIGQAENTAGFQLSASMEIEGVPLQIIRPVLYKYTDPVKGELYQPLVIAPPVLITPSRNVLISYNEKPQTITYEIRALKDVVAPKLITYDAVGWKSNQLATAGKDTLKKGMVEEVAVKLTPTNNRKLGKEVLTASVQVEQEYYASLRKQIRYDHIPNIDYFRSNAVQLVRLDLKTVGKRIAFIEGAGDYMPVALQQMGYEVTRLSDADLLTAHLGGYDAIITGVRAYNIKEALNTAYERLMQYVFNGGNLIVQYNTSNQIGPVRSRISPYPFTISRTRITDQQAKVNFLLPQHPVLNVPNKITDKDFEGWVQERSIYHAAGWDDRYQAILSMQDPNEKADAGSLLIGQYGKGHFVYTGLVLFRELPAGVPGAYRLLANLIALGKK